MHLEVFRSFLAISKYKSMSKAAEALHITQPTLSTRIKNLEEQLEIPLLTRDWQGVHLTNYGVVLLPHAIDMLHKLNDFTSIKENYKDMNNESLLETIEEMNDTFRIGINNYLTANLSEKVINLLVEEFPTVQFEFVTTATNNLIELMDYDALDLIIFYSTDETDQPNTKLLALDETVFVFHEEDYEETLKNPQYISTMNKPLLLNSNPALERYLNHFQHVIKHLHITDFKIISNLNLMRQLILAGQGYAAIPKSLYDVHFNVPHIHAYKLSANLPSLPVYMRWKETSAFTPVIEAIYELLSSDDFL